ncbi:non-canonical purine NTP pyrophosphatase [Sulfurimonas sp. HSL1-2]|uniref:non-canonical purine NTP pyrophosphatase n=1 Tax=Thiomicrolovo zhangzhouensis TaxID=3131933 RepID=UPI0031F95B00
MKIRFVTNNLNKLAEVKKMIDAAEIVATELKIEEIQTDNVKKLVKDKLLKAFKKVGRPVFVEHTGLYLDSLNSFPGGLTQIFWDKLEADRFSKLLGTLDTTTAIARTTIGYCDGKKIHYFDGEIIGNISPEPKGERRFQWDCVFIPDGEEQTFAELGDKKNEISMRKIAFDKFNKYLKEGN